MKYHADTVILYRLQGITLPDLPYAYTALEPHISERTLRIHHDKHHAKYVATTNDMIKGTDMEENDVVTVLRKAFTTNQVLFNNAAQSFNHEFYWNVSVSSYFSPQQTPNSL